MLDGTTVGRFSLWLIPDLDRLSCYRRFMFANHRMSGIVRKLRYGREHASPVSRGRRERHPEESEPPDPSPSSRIFPVGGWRGKVIGSEGVAATAAEPGDPAGEWPDTEALERYWAAWNDPVLMKQRAADAAAEAEAERIWNENRIGLRGYAAQECETTAETDEPEIELTG